MRKREVVSIVGGGFSFKYVDHQKIPGTVIAVNEAGVLLRRKVDVIVSMDRLWTENRWDQVRALRVPFWVRRSALKNVEGWKDNRYVHVFENDHTSVKFSDDPQTLNGTNSGACAINLAYIMRPEILYLFGFDMCRHANGNPYWHEPYPWAAKNGSTKPATYASWAKEFNEIALQFAAMGTEVVNVSEYSQIRAFRRMSPNELGMGLI